MGVTWTSLAVFENYAGVETLEEASVSRVPP